MAKHAKLSPSSAARWLTCPGSVALCEGLENKSSSFADEGTAAHDVAAQCLTTSKPASEQVGRTVLTDGGEEVLVTEDMAEHVQVYVDYVNDVVKSSGGELFVEVAVPLQHLTNEKDAEGTSDAVIIAGDEITVIDLKFGRGVEVSAENNEQLMLYASGVLRKFAMAGDFENVRMAISQPRISRQPSEWSCTVKELRAFEMHVMVQAAAVNNMVAGREPVVLTASDKGCKWCLAKATCPTLAKFVQDQIGADFSEVLTGPKLVVQETDLPLHMAAVDLVEEWCKAVRAKVESELLNGKEVEGYKLVQGRNGARAWSDNVEAEAMLKRMRLKVAEMYDLSLISPTTAEKLAKAGKIGKKQWPLVVEMITQREGKPSVAPVTDKRPALVVTPTADDFENLTS